MEYNSSMIVLYSLIGIFIVSFILAIRSMKDFYTPKEIHRLISMKKVRGSIVFFKDKINHYSSSSSSSTSTS